MSERSVRWFLDILQEEGVFDIPRPKWGEYVFRPRVIQSDVMTQWVEDAGAACVGPGDQPKATGPDQADADAIIRYALTICMYGERAPGGDENWPEFGRRAEEYMRRRTCAKYGHTPDEPTCPDC